MKITVLMPPPLEGKRAADRCYGCNYGIYFLPHIPTLSIATLLRDKGFNIAIEDFAAKKRSKKDFVKFIKSDDSDVYLFYTVFLSERTDLLARDIIKEIKPNSKFIYCGTQPTWNPEAFLSENSFVVRGEPELSTLELINCLSKNKSVDKIKGISLFKNRRAIHNGARLPIKNLDNLPIPDRTLLDHCPYYNPKLTKTPHTAIITSRGCFGRCWFCVPNSLSFSRELEHKRACKIKPAPRLHSVKRIIAEFKEIARLGFKSISILDDEFIWGDKRTIAICNGIKNLNLEWFCLARPDVITEKSVAALAEAGCKYIDLGVESFNQKILDNIRKGIRVEDIWRAVQIIKKYGVEPKINILFGASPLETEETIKQTIEEAEKLDVDYILYDIAAPFPGTDFYYAAKDKKWFTTKDNEYHPIDPSKEAIISYPHLSKKKMEELLAYAYRRHYFSSKYIIKQLKNIKSLGDFKNKILTAFNIFNRNVLKNF